MRVLHSKRAQTNERGAVLLTTLLVMGIMAALAVALIDDIRFAVKRAVNTQSYAQADWYALAAEDFALTYLTENLINSAPAAVNSALRQNEPIVFPIEGGAISLIVRDGSQCFSLGALETSPGRRQFRQLLETLGWDTLAAAQLTSVAVDWMDADGQTLPNGAEDYRYLGLTPSYRAPNTAFSSVMEMRALAGMDEEKFQILRPFLCARDTGAPIGLNINTLTNQHAPLLAALLGGNDKYELALQLIQERPTAGYESREQILALPIMEGAEIKNANFEALSTEPENIWVEAEIYYLEARRSVILEYVIEDSQRITRTFRRFNDEARRPVMLEEPS